MKQPKLGMIVAATHCGGIGWQGGLPWKNLKGDLKNFRNLTMGNVVIMGRKTFESIGKPLDGRINIVIAGSNYEYWTERKAEFPDAEVHYVFDLKTALTLAQHFGTEWVWFIGGTRIFERVLPHVERVALTLVHGDYMYDTMVKGLEFPESDWRKAQSVTVFNDDETTQLGTPSHTYMDFVRKPKAGDSKFLLDELFSSIFSPPVPTQLNKVSPGEDGK